MMLELRNICKTYLQGRLEVPVLQGISLSVEEGEYLAIMGPSGSGKTTLMNIIGCLDNPTSGDYILDGEDIGRISEKRMSEVRLHNIGFVFQSFYLLSRQSALDNVALPLLYAGVRRKERQRIARNALERVGLGDRTGFQPNQLSGGQCQRVAIARSIVNNPKILLADEPTGALDTKSGQQIMEIFQRLNEEGVTIVMITHEPEIAAQAKRILHIRDGQLVDSAGKPLNPPAETQPEQAEPSADQPTALAAGEEKDGPEPAAEDSPSKGLPWGLDKRLESLRERLPEVKERLAGLLPRKSPAQTAEAADPPEDPKAENQPEATSDTQEASGEAPTASQEDPQKAPEPAKAKPEKPSGGHQAGQAASSESEPPLSGESIIAALKRQAGQLDQDGTPEGGEGPSHEQ